MVFDIPFFCSPVKHGSRRTCSPFSLAEPRLGGVVRGGLRTPHLPHARHTNLGSPSACSVRSEPCLTVPVHLSPGARASRPRGAPPYGPPPWLPFRWLTQTVNRYALPCGLQPGQGCAIMRLFYAVQPQGWVKKGDILPERPFSPLLCVAQPHESL
jgi:hypothetical protein